MSKNRGENGQFSTSIFWPFPLPNGIGEINMLVEYLKQEKQSDK